MASEEKVTIPAISFRHQITDHRQRHPFYVELLEQADKNGSGSLYRDFVEQAHSPSTESVCAFLLFQAIGAARDRNSDEMMYWQRAYLDVKSFLRIGFDFDTYFENRRSAV
jgi:hypothetical protein